VDYRAHLLNLRTTYKLKLSKQLPLKDKRKKNRTQPPGEIMTGLLLNYEHQDWMLEE
jgi:hypothetical protein